MIDVVVGAASLQWRLYVNSQSGTRVPAANLLPSPSMSSSPSDPKCPNCTLSVRTAFWILTFASTMKCKGLTTCKLEFLTKPDPQMPKETIKQLQPLCCWLLYNMIQAVTSFWRKRFRLLRWPWPIGMLSFRHAVQEYWKVLEELA